MKGADIVKITYKQPADAWLEALPLGNGSLGAMMFGGVEMERLDWNEDTLWSGKPTDWNNPEALCVLPQIRKAVDEGRYDEADRLSKRAMGPYTQS